MLMDRSRIIFLACLPILFILGYLLVIDKSAKDSELNIEVSPRNSEIKVDGANGKFGINKLASGQHEITVSKKGFENQTRSITTTHGTQTYAGFTLKSNSSETQNWYKLNSKDQKLAETISSHQVDYDNKIAAKNNSILQVLPVVYGDGKGGTVRIDSGIPLQGSSEPAIYVSAATPDDRQGVLTWMRSRGYNPARMDIVFNGAYIGIMPLPND